MTLIHAEAINVAIDAVDIEPKKRKQCISWLLQFGGVYCPKRNRTIIECFDGNRYKVNIVRRT